MQTHIIEPIFADYCHTNEYAKLATTPDIEKTLAVILQTMGDTREHDDQLANLLAKVEENTFAIGFRYGIRFMCERLVEVPHD